MAKAKKVTPVITIPVQAERTEADLLQAMQNFAHASIGTIGMSRTVDVLEFLTEKITDSPESYQKITAPETVAKFKDVLDRNSGGMPNPMELMGLIGTFKSIFA